MLGKKKKNILKYRIFGLGPLNEASTQDYAMFPLTARWRETLFLLTMNRKTPKSLNLPKERVDFLNKYSKARIYQHTQTAEENS